MIRDAGLPVERTGLIVWTKSLAGEEIERRVPGRATPQNMAVTPVRNCHCAQDYLHNLAWKLAAVLHGQAAPSLLDTYHDERQPLGVVITEASLANSLSMGWLTRQTDAKLPRPEFLNEQGLIFGASYESAAVIPDGTPPAAVTDPVTQYVPSARPGSRAPHVWLERDGARISTIDLFGPRFVLLTGRRGGAWREAAQLIAGPSLFPLVAHTIGRDCELTDIDGTWQSVYAIDDDGAVLVRPDGYVAWRSRSGSDAPARTLQAAMDGVLGLTPS